MGVSLMTGPSSLLHPPSNDMAARLAMYDRLWEARQNGLEALSLALVKSIKPGLPTNRFEIKQNLDVRRGSTTGLVKFYGLSPDYRGLVQPPPAVKTKMDALNRMQRLTKANALFGLVVLAATTKVNDLAMIIPFVGLIALQLSLKGVQTLDELDKLQAEYAATPEAELLIQLSAAFQAAQNGNRDEEIHFLALAANRIYQEEERSEQDSQRLAQLAQRRGSHHAAHCLWMLCQDTPLANWPYDPTLTDQALGGGKVVVQETMNLAIRESSDFRTAFLEDLNRRRLPPHYNHTTALAHRLSNKP